MRGESLWKVMGFLLGDGDHYNRCMNVDYLIWFDDVYVIELYYRDKVYNSYYFFSTRHEVLPI
jgi:hypothetical protein